MITLAGESLDERHFPALRKKWLNCFPSISSFPSWVLVSQCNIWMWLLLNLRGKWRRKFAARQRRSYLPSLMQTWENVVKRRLLTICVESSSWPNWTIAGCRLIGYWLALHVLIDDDAPLAIHRCKN